MIDDKRLFGREIRNKRYKDHWHIIIFHKNICLGIFIRSKKSSHSPIVDMFYNDLCKK